MVYKQSHTTHTHTHVHTYTWLQAVLALAASWTSRQVGERTLTGTVIDSGDGVTHAIPVVRSTLQQVERGWRIQISLSFSLFPGWRIRHWQLYQAHSHRWSRHYVFHSAASEREGVGNSPRTIPRDSKGHQGAIWVHLPWHCQGIQQVWYTTRKVVQDLRWSQLYHEESEFTHHIEYNGDAPSIIMTIELRWIECNNYGCLMTFFVHESRSWHWYSNLFRLTRLTLATNVSLVQRSSSIQSSRTLTLPHPSLR